MTSDEEEESVIGSCVLREDTMLKEWMAVRTKWRQPAATLSSAKQTLQDVSPLND